MKTLNQLIASHNFNWVNSDIEKNFKLEKVRSSDYKLYHFDKYISSEDAIKEMAKDGYLPATITELLKWKGWNDKDWVIALGSVAKVGGGRLVACLGGFGTRRGLGLGWFGSVWGDDYRF